MKKTLVSGAAMAKHLDVSITYIAKLCADDVIGRRPDGKFDQDAARLKYLKWLRDPQRRAARSEAASEFDRAKTRLLELRIAEREGLLMLASDCEAFHDDLCAQLRAGLAGMGARCSRGNPVIRKAIDDAGFELLERLSARAEKQAIEAEVVLAEATAPNEEAEAKHPEIH